MVEVKAIFLAYGDLKTLQVTPGVLMIPSDPVC